MTARGEVNLYSAGLCKTQISISFIFTHVIPVHYHKVVRMKKSLWQFTNPISWPCLATKKGYPPSHPCTRANIVWLGRGRMTSRLANNLSRRGMKYLVSDGTWHDVLRAENRFVFAFGLNSQAHGSNICSWYLAENSRACNTHSCRLQDVSALERDNLNPQWFAYWDTQVLALTAKQLPQPPWFMTGVMYMPPLISRQSTDWGKGPCSGGLGLAIWGSPWLNLHQIRLCSISMLPTLGFGRVLDSFWPVSISQPWQTCCGRVMQPYVRWFFLRIAHEFSPSRLSEHPARNTQAHRSSGVPSFAIF